MTDILDIKGIQVWDWTYYWLALAVFLVLLMALVAWRIWRRYFRKGKIFEENLSPLERAMRRLDELPGRGYLDTGKIRLFYFNLSEIFRDFLEEEVKIKAGEATLEELRPLLKSLRDFTQEEISQALWLMEMSDLAKFARYEPPKEDIIKSVKVCRVLIETLARRRESVQVS